MDGTGSRKDFSRRTRAFSRARWDCAQRRRWEIARGLTPANSGCRVIDVSDGGVSFAQLGANHSTPRHRYDTNWQALDNFSWKIGKHDVKFGYEYRRTSIQQFFGANYRGKLEFDSDFLSGTVDDGGQSLGQSVRHTSQNNHGLYVQDTYQVNTHLTFNFGVRWDYFGVVSEKDNLFTNVTAFDPAAQTVTLTQLGQSGLSQTYHPDYKNFSPRVSVAWDPLGHGKTIVRAGWGMFLRRNFAGRVFGRAAVQLRVLPGAWRTTRRGRIRFIRWGRRERRLRTGVPIFSAPTGAAQGNIFAISQHLPTAVHGKLQRERAGADYEQGSAGGWVCGGAGAPAAALPGCEPAGSSVDHGV